MNKDDQSEPARVLCRLPTFSPKLICQLLKGCLWRKKAYCSQEFFKSFTNLDLLFPVDCLVNYLARWYLVESSFLKLFVNHGVTFRQLLLGCPIIHEMSAVVMVIVSVSPNEHFLTCMRVQGPVNSFDRFCKVQ